MTRITVDWLTARFSSVITPQCKKTVTHARATEASARAPRWTVDQATVGSTPKPMDAPQEVSVYQREGWAVWTPHVNSGASAVVPPQAQSTASQESVRKCAFPIRLTWMVTALSSISCSARKRFPRLVEYFLSKTTTVYLNFTTMAHCRCHVHCKLF